MERSVKFQTQTIPCLTVIIRTLVRQPSPSQVRRTWRRNETSISPLLPSRFQIWPLSWADRRSSRLQRILIWQPMLQNIQEERSRQVWPLRMGTLQSLRAETIRQVPWMRSTRQVMMRITHPRHRQSWWPEKEIMVALPWPFTTRSHQRTLHPKQAVLRSQIHRNWLRMVTIACRL